VGEPGDDVGQVGTGEDGVHFGGEIGDSSRGCERG